MPRMEIVPAEESTEIAHKEWKKKGDAGTTFDVCSQCADEVDGLNLRDINSKLRPKSGEPEGEYVLTGDVEHPPYHDGELVCEICGVKLNDDNA